MGHSADGINRFEIGKFIIPDVNKDDQWRSDVDGPISHKDYYSSKDPMGDRRSVETLDRLGISPKNWRKGLEGIKSLSAAKDYLDYFNKAEKVPSYFEKSKKVDSTSKSEELETYLTQAQNFAKKAGLPFNGEKAAALRSQVQKYVRRDQLSQKALDALYDGNETGAERYLQQAEAGAKKDNIPFDGIKTRNWLRKASQIKNLGEMMDLSGLEFTEGNHNYIKAFLGSRPFYAPRKAERSIYQMHEAKEYAKENKLPWNPEREERLLLEYNKRGVDFSTASAKKRQIAPPKLKDVIYAKDLESYEYEVKVRVELAQYYLEKIYSSKTLPEFQRKESALQEIYKRALVLSEKLARIKARACHKEGHSACADEFFKYADINLQAVRDYGNE